MESPEKNIKLVIQYDGTLFHGFQKQKDGPRTVQEEVEKALERLTGETTPTEGAGRTDAGVHALGQVVSFKTTTRIPPVKIASALRVYLPEDIQTVDSIEVDGDFSARFSARAKEYGYYLYQSAAPVPVLRNYALFVPGEIDCAAMAEALTILEGEHDFSALKNEGSSPANPVKTIYRTGASRKGCFIKIVVYGSGFLYKMVRNIVGTVLEVGLGKRDTRWIREVLESGDRTLAGRTVGPQGLYLYRVDYEKSCCVKANRVKESSGSE